PIFLFCIPVAFYSIAATLGLSMEQLQDAGWLFKLPSPMKPFYTVYQRFDFVHVQWSVLPKTIPAMLALTFFSILHVPINVPALSVTIAQDGVDLSHELLAHGISNVLAGLCGSVQNYLVYSNSVLFIKCGGNSRVAGVALAACTLVAFFVGPALIAYVPVMVVASLIFHLGMELLKEALYHPWGRVHPLEYATMVAIILSMATIGFIEGVLVGGFLACVFFVVLYSQRRAVRRWMTGGPGGARSAVRRPARQRQYLDALGEQLHLFELQGFLFFGTVNALEETIERIVTGHAPGPVARFIIMDFSLVTGLDFSAAEALVRVKRVLAANDVCLVVAGVAAGSEIGQALQSVGLWGGTRLDVYVQNARTAQQAMEWCENQLLKCYYDHAEELSHALRPPLGESARRSIAGGSQHADDSEGEPLQLGQMTPRTEMIAQAARYLLPDDAAEQHVDFESTALNTVAAAFTRHFLRRGQIVWRAHTPPDSIYLLDRGTMAIAQGEATVVETILPGALTGSIGLVTGRPSPYHLVADSDATVWRLTTAAYQQLCQQHPEVALWLVSAIMALHTGDRFVRH
ncbi:sulfate transporter family-domain-containing protein, partial [Syncephalis pseudoplumigaleata]